MSPSVSDPLVWHTIANTRRLSLRNIIRSICNSGHQLICAPPARIKATLHAAGVQDRRCSRGLRGCEAQSMPTFRSSAYSNLNKENVAIANPVYSISSTPSFKDPSHCNVFRTSKWPSLERYRATYHRNQQMCRLVTAGAYPLVQPSVSE
jgi:hypothetical protein